MNQLLEIMDQHPEFCNTETRVPELLYILKKYNLSEIVIVDFNHHPVGILNKNSVTDEALENVVHPFDLKAEKIMTHIPMTLKMDTTIQDSIKLMDEKHLKLVPVVNEVGEYLGIVKKENLIREMSH